MISDNDQRPLANILRHYQEGVRQRYPDYVSNWPIINGWNFKGATFKDWNIYVISDAGPTSMCSQYGLGELGEDVIGYSDISDTNRDAVRRRLEIHYRIRPVDFVLLWPPNGDLAPEFNAMLQRHETALGIAKMRIFLSHKGFDKPTVRSYKQTLDLLGFHPWLDEDALTAGSNLDRGILQGFHDSCAAVFFVTDKFKDQGVLATEVDYAIQEKRRKGEKFSIITLVFGSGANKGVVPDLLHTYVWKEPQSELEALRDILKALPVAVGSVGWR